MLFSRLLCRSLAISLLSITIAACGGGGGGSSSSKDTSPLTYNGVTTAATITSDNANSLLANAFSGPESAAPASRSYQMTSLDKNRIDLPFSHLANSTKRIESTHKTSHSQSPTSIAKAANNFEYVDCDISGRIGISGELDENYQGTLKVIYDDCNDDGMTLDGKATLTFGETSILTESSFITFSMDGESINFSGSILDEWGYDPSYFTVLTINGVTQSGPADTRFKWVDFKIVDAYPSYPGFEQTISGRVYDSELGYIDITTPTPLIFSSEALDYPDGGGIILIAGANGSQARLTSLSTSKVRIEVDANGDEVFENSAPYFWDNLVGEPSLNEADTDEIEIAAPSSAQATQNVPFQSPPLVAVAGNGLPISYSLLYGPKGMQIDPNTGAISWTPNITTFGKTQQVNYGVRANAGDATSDKTLQINVTNPNFTEPLVRTSFNFPFDAHNGLAAADFNNDGIDEIVMTSRGSVYTLAFDGKDYTQDWVYPYDLGDDVDMSVGTADLNGDSHPDIVVGSYNKITIFDGLTRTISGVINDQLRAHRSISIVDIDRDGSLELIYLATARSDASTNTWHDYTINVYNAATLEREWQSYENDFGGVLAIGNVDNDPALEIVTSKGYVYDGITKANEWASSASFGDQIAVADADNDGIDDIITIDRDSIHIFSAVAKAKTWETLRNFASMSALLVANIDEDPQPEIIVGGGQWDNISAYDGLSRSSEWTISSNTWAVSDLLVGNFSNDGKAKLLWTGRGVINQFYDGAALLIAHLNAPPELAWNSAQPVSGAFNGGLWLQTNNNQRQAVFSSTLSGGLPVFATVSPQSGKVDLYPMTGSSYYNGPNVTSGADFDNDGIDEIFVTKQQTTSSSPRTLAYDINTQTIEWTSPELSTTVAITNADINGDGHSDVIFIGGEYYSYGNTIYAYSPSTSTLLWKSEKLSAYGRDIAVQDINNDGNLEIVALTDNGILIYRKQNDSFVSDKVLIFDDTPSANLVIGNIDDDPQLEVISVASRSYTGTSIIKIFDGSTLEEQNRFELSGDVSALAIAPDNPAHLLVATHMFTYSPTFDTLSEVDAKTGGIILSSPVLLGNVMKNSLRTADIDNDGASEIIIGTTQAMYITR